MNLVCRSCGGTDFYYNPTRMRMICRSCMTPYTDPLQDQQLMQYDQTCSIAGEHLIAGNWQEVIRILRPLTNQHPTDKRLYKALLRAATMDYSDIDMDSEYNRSEASDAWNKLLRLNGIDNDMRAYSARRYQKHRKELLHKRNIFLAWLLGGSAGALSAGILFSSRHYFLFILALAVCGYCLYRSLISKPYQVFKRLLASRPNYNDNPFV